MRALLVLAIVASCDRTAEDEEIKRTNRIEVAAIFQRNYSKLDHPSAKSLRITAEGDKSRELVIDAPAEFCGQLVMRIVKDHSAILTQQQVASVSCRGAAIRVTAPWD